MRQYYSNSTKVDLDRDAARRRGVIQKTLLQVRTLDVVHAELAALICNNRDHPQLLTLTAELMQLRVEIARANGKVLKLEREQAQVQARRIAMDAILEIINGCE